MTPEQQTAFVEAVKFMRGLQRQYLKNRAAEVLKRCKGAEKRVDDLLQALDDEQRAAVQPSLFGGGR